MDISQVKDEIAKGLRSFKAFEKAHEVLTTLENIENQILERGKFLEELKAACDGLQSLKDTAFNFAEQVKTGAAKEARSLLDAAKDHAEKGLADAKFKADNMIEAAKAALNKHAAEADLLAEANTKARGLLLSAKKELAEIEKYLAEHRSDMTKFLNK